jgi:FkbM family methyltransferase
MAEGDSGLIQGSAADEVLMPIYARDGTWAVTTVNFLKAYLGPAGGTYLDIGANIGLTTLPIAKDARVRCIALEPDPTNFYHLSENVRRNAKNSNIELHQLAAMAHPGVISFALNSSGNPGDHRVASEPCSRATIDVKAVALDTLVGVLSGPVALKIDTQGAEPYVMEGARRIISQAGALVIEFCPYMMSQLKGAPETVFDLLREYERIAIISGEGLARLEFCDTTRATNQLARFFKESKNSENLYRDVYATR